MTQFHFIYALYATMFQVIYKQFEITKYFAEINKLKFVNVALLIKVQTI